MRPPRYLGVSGVTTRDQVDELLDAWPADAPPQSLMIGVLASQKTLSGGERNARSPAPEHIASIFPADPRALNLVHYFTTKPETLCEQLIRAVGFGGSRCDGVQINVRWPPVEQLEEFSQWVGRRARVVLQVGPEALADVQGLWWKTGSVTDMQVRAWNLRARFDRYHGLITDILIDGSGGRGLPLDASLTRVLVETLRLNYPDLGIIVAGGLCAETLPAIAGLVQEYGLSVDAEGKLRSEDDGLDIGKARAWLRAAALMVCRGDR